MQILSLSLVLTLGSILWLRRSFYELFSRTHVISAVIVIGLLWFHIPMQHRSHIVVLAVMSGLLVIQRLVCMFRTRTRSEAVIDHFGSISRIRITVKKPWEYRPGNYIHIRTSSLKEPFYLMSQFQSHPYLISWFDKSSGSLSNNFDKDPVSSSKTFDQIHLLIDAQQGFSRYIQRSQIQNILLQIDGPYGNLYQIEKKYDKVVCLSEGLGITSQLATIKFLLDQGNKSRVRRIDLIWHSQSEGLCEAVDTYAT
jgi:predicted ferric reductase